MSRRAPATTPHGRPGRHRHGIRGAWLAFALLACGFATAACAAGTPAQPADAKVFPQQEGTLWTPFLEWEVGIGAIDHIDNPFDVIAEVKFQHPDSGEVRSTQMFHDGDDSWRFRFAGTRTGEWTFATASREPALDGLSGRILIHPNPDPDARGFLTTQGNRFAIYSGEDGELQGRLYNVYMRHDASERLSDYDRNPERFAADVDAALNEVAEHGFDAVLVLMANNWFRYGRLRHDRHDEENPDLAAFQALESLIVEAHARGLSAHIWAWGDEHRLWTQRGVDGGINGVADRRLQRYIAARLGALPGWTMSYGFDLEEWVTVDEVRDWHRFLKAHLGWPRLLMARESPIGQPGSTFDLGEDKLDVHAHDERPDGDFYELAVALQDRGYVPVLAERRFLHTRDGVWDMDTTRRALWEFTMAGGMGAIWGVMWGGGPRYPEPGQLRVHGEFWRDRFLLDLERANALTDGLALRAPDDTRFVFYRAHSDAIEIDLSRMDAPRTAVAVDVRAQEYREIPLGELAARRQVWNAPHRSDWAIAVGF
jgi:hypothetical protein